MTFGLILCISFIAGVFTQNITTIPHLPENTLASGYSGLKLSSQFIGQPYPQCSWTFGSFNEPFYNGQCFNFTQNGLQVECVIDAANNSLVTTSLLVQYSLNQSHYPISCALQCLSSFDGSVLRIASTSIEIQGN